MMHPGPVPRNWCIWCYLGAELLQKKEVINCGCDEVPDSVTLHPTASASKSLLNTEWWYSNIKWKAIGILHALEKFNHYSFAKEVYGLMVSKHGLYVGSPGLIPITATT